MEVKTGDIVVYRNTGVCTMMGQTEKMLGDEEQTGYVLEPFYIKHMTVFAPLALANRIHPLPSDAELHSSLEQLSKAEVRTWVMDAMKRKQQFSNCMLYGTHAEVLQMVREIHLCRKKRRSKATRVICATDERLYRDSVRVLSEEIAYVMHMKTEEAETYLIDAIEKSCQSLQAE